MELLYTGKPVFLEGTYTSEADYFKATFEVDYVQLVLYTQDFIKLSSRMRQRIANGWKT